MAELTEAQQAWVNELRTTDKPQTTGALHKLDSDGNTVGFCCLGIWCEMALKRGVELSIAKVENRISYNYNWADLPFVAQEALGVFRRNPNLVILNNNYDSDKVNDDEYFINENGVEVCQETNPSYLLNESVAELNDSGFTFAQIADLVEYAGLTD